MFSLLKNKTENLKKANSLKITLINSLRVNIINIFVENKFSKINLVRRVAVFSVFCEPPVSDLIAGFSSLLLYSICYYSCHTSCNLWKASLYICKRMRMETLQITPQYSKVPLNVSAQPSSPPEVLGPHF